jgi:hypothetical protein
MHQRVTNQSGMKITRPKNKPKVNKSYRQIKVVFGIYFALFLIKKDTYADQSTV